MHRFIVASLAAGLGMGLAAASAADLGRPAPAPVYAKAPMGAPLSWTGCYLGANAGGAFVHNKEFAAPAGLDFGSDTTTGLVAGGQIGCDYQVSAWVFGIQGQFDWAGLNATHDVPGTAGLATVATDTKWLATATGRLGYTVAPVVLVYGKGGVAWTRNDININVIGFQFPATDNRVGWTAGAGLEYMFAPNWSLFAEYNFVGFGTKTVNFPGPIDVTQDIQTATVGVNWHLRPW